MSGDLAVIEIILLLSYMVVLFTICLLLVRQLKLHVVMGKEPQIVPPRVSSISQLKSIWAIIKHTIIALPTVISAISIILIILLSAYAAVYQLAKVEYQAESIHGKFLILEFSSIVNVSDVLENMRRLMIPVKGYSRMLRILFDTPHYLAIDTKEIHIYAIVLIDKAIIPMDIYGLKVNEYGIIGYPELGVSRIKLDNINFTIRGVNPELLERCRILGIIPLLPIQGYVAAKPIYVPSESTIVFEYSVGLKALKLNGEPVSTIIFPEVELEESKVRSLFSSLNSLSKVYTVNNGRVTCFYSAFIPSWRSLALAILSSILGSIMFIPTVSVIAVKLRDLEDKALLSGLQPNVIALSLSTFLTLLFGVIGVILIFTLSSLMGSYVLFNTITTLILILIFTYVYTSRTLTGITVKESPLPRGVSFTIRMDMDRTLSVIEDLIKTNEFFEVLEYDIIRGGGEVYVYTSVRYLMAWGVGVDLHLNLTSTEESMVKVDLTYKPWSVEEISDRYLNSMVRLFIGRLIGGLTPWRT